MSASDSISNEQKQEIDGLLQQAVQAMGEGRLDVCDQLCGQIDAIHLGIPDVANLRGVLCARIGDHARAEHLFVYAVNAAPERIDFCNNLGMLYLEHRLFAEAARVYSMALAKDDSSILALRGYARALIELGDCEQAVDVLNKAIELDSEDADLWLGLYTAYHKMQRFDEARATLDTALERYPEHAHAIYELASFELAEGKVDAGRQGMYRTLEIVPEHIDAHVQLAYITKFRSNDDPDVGRVKAMYDKSEPGSKNREYFSFAMGKIMDDLGDYDAAFDYFREGNEIRHAYSTYNPDAELAHMQAITEHFTPEVLQHRSELSDETPVFIVGMPRCGSTLTEQIIAAHPDVRSKGKWESFESVLGELHTQQQPLTLERMADFSSQQWGEIGQRFLERLGSHLPPALRITDKTLTHIRLLGAIHCAMPKARIIHVRRDPLDTCLSIYKSDFRETLFDYAYNLGELGYYYRMYQRLMQHWREVLPAGVMYELDYEKLVGNQEAETRRLIDFCGLAWDDACLAFDRSHSAARGNTLTQVLRPMYSDAVVGWKHYEKHLQPLIRILGND